MSCLWGGGRKKGTRKKQSRSAWPKQLPKTISLHIHYAPPTLLHHLRGAGDGEKTKLGGRSENQVRDPELPRTRAD